LNNTYSDNEIEEKIRSGEANPVVAYVYKAFYPRVRDSILSKNGSVEHAKDIFQEAVMVLVKVVLERRYENGINIQAFLLSISQRMWIDKIRKDKKLTFADDFRVYDYVDENPYEHKHHFDEDRSRAIDEILSSIGERCKEIIRLVIYNGLSMKEIAEELNFSSENSAKTQHYKCRQKLIKRYRGNEELKELLSSE
jgi:RNA polymerase sigma factor (sigma-70 family)